MAVAFNACALQAEVQCYQKTIKEAAEKPRLVYATAIRCLAEAESQTPETHPLRAYLRGVGKTMEDGGDLLSSEVIIGHIDLLVMVVEGIVKSSLPHSALDLSPVGAPLSSSPTKITRPIALVSSVDSIVTDRSLALSPAAPEKISGIDEEDDLDGLHKCLAETMGLGSELGSLFKTHKDELSLMHSRLTSVTASGAALKERIRALESEKDSLQAMIKVVDVNAEDRLRAMQAEFKSQIAEIQEEATARMIEFPIRGFSNLLKSLGMEILPITMTGGKKTLWGYEFSLQMDIIEENIGLHLCCSKSSEPAVIPIPAVTTPSAAAAPAAPAAAAAAPDAPGTPSLRLTDRRWPIGVEFQFMVRKFRDSKLATDEGVLGSKRLPARFNGENKEGMKRFATIEQIISEGGYNVPFDEITFGVKIWPKENLRWGHLVEGNLHQHAIK